MFVKIVRYLRESERAADLSSLRLTSRAARRATSRSSTSGGRSGAARCSTRTAPPSASRSSPTTRRWTRAAAGQRRPRGAGGRDAGSSVGDGVEVARGDVGVALWRSPGMMVGYWNEPELTAGAMTADGWFRGGGLRPHGRGRLRLHRRPRLGHDHPRRQQRLAVRGRGGAHRRPAHRRSRRRGAARRRVRRSGRRRRS